MSIPAGGVGSARGRQLFRGRRLASPVRGTSRRLARRFRAEWIDAQRQYSAIQAAGRQLRWGRRLR